MDAIENDCGVSRRGVGGLRWLVRRTHTKAGGRKSGWAGVLKINLEIRV